MFWEVNIRKQTEEFGFEARDVESSGWRLARTLLQTELFCPLEKLFKSKIYKVLLSNSLIIKAEFLKFS